MDQLPETTLQLIPEARLRLAKRIYGAAYLGEKEDLVTGQRHPEPGWCWEKASPVQQQFCLRQADAALDELVKLLFEHRAAALRPYLQDRPATDVVGPQAISER